MAKVTLTDLTSLANDTSSTNSINTNFQTLEDYINNNVLSRDTGAEVNTMQNDIDMNNYDLLNVTEINGNNIDTLLNGILTQVGYAGEWANNAEDTLVSAAAGGDQVDDYSALHWSIKAIDAQSAAVAAQGLAETAKTAAETAQGLAETAQAAAETVYDNFDDRYLGQKAADPTLDNDGDALLTGALYFNTSSSEMRVYSGSAWEAAYLPASSYAAVGSNNTWTAAQAGSTQTNAATTGSVTLDFDTYQNFILTFTGNVTLANPTTENVGQSGFICVIQDGTGSRTLTLGTDYETAEGAGLTISTTASATDIIPYIIIATDRILLGQAQLAFA